MAAKHRSLRTIIVADRLRGVVASGDACTNGWLALLWRVYSRRPRAGVIRVGSCGSWASLKASLRVLMCLGRRLRIIWRVVTCVDVMGKRAL